MCERTSTLNKDSHLARVWVGVCIDYINNNANCIAINHSVRCLG